MLLIMWPTCFLDFTMVFLAYMACWIVHSLKAYVSLLIHLHKETDYMDKLSEWLQWNLKLEILHSAVKVLMRYYIFTSIWLLCHMCCYTVCFVAVCECLWNCVDIWYMSCMFVYAMHVSLYVQYFSSTNKAAIQYCLSSIFNVFSFHLIFNREEQV